MKITGTMVNYYMHCKRQCFFLVNDIECYQDHDLVKIGRFLHELYEEDDKKVQGDNFIVDKVEGDYVIEYKKSKADIEAAKWQLTFYLWQLKQVGVEKVGLIKFNDNRGDIKVKLTSDRERNLSRVLEKIRQLKRANKPPNIDIKDKRGCQRCAYFELCYC